MKNTGFFQPVLAKYSKSFNLSDTLSVGRERANRRRKLALTPYSEPDIGNLRSSTSTAVAVDGGL
jgi:hypothetical protein